MRAFELFSRHRAADAQRMLHRMAVTGWLSPEDCQAGDLLWLRWDAAAFFVALPGNTSAAVMMRSSYRPSENAGEFPAPLPSSAAPLYSDKPSI